MQTKLQSLVEVCTSTAIAFFLSLCLQVFLTWAYAMPMTLSQNLQWTLWFTLLAIARGYLLRRFFNWLHSKK